MSQSKEFFKKYPNIKIVRKYTTAQLKNMLSEISDNIETMEEELTKAKKENTELKSEAYKDEEIKRLKKQLDEKNETIIRLSCSTFKITENEKAEIDKFTREHNHGSTGAIGGQFTYEFVPTSIGTVGTIKCSCGKEFTFHELG